MQQRRRLFLPLSRRTFVKLAAASAASAAFVGCGPSGAEAEEVDNLIIGSGFGGSISAYRLAQAGHSSVVLERGRRWTVQNPGDDVFSDMGFTEGDRYDHRCRWLGTTAPLPGLPPLRPLVPYTGVLERIPGDGIDIVCAAGVGGGSLVYSGMMVRPRDDHFESVFPSEITARSMDPYYERVRELVQPSSLPDDLLELEPWAASRTFIEQGMRAGYDVQRLLCGFDWDKARAEARGELPPQLIRGSYIFGLNNGAKATLDKLYLGMAEATGLVDVRPLHWAQRIIRDGARWRVEVDVIDEMGVVQESIAFSARRLFVCAGTANTNALLVRARDEDTIPDLPDSLGEGFGNNGQHIRARRGVGVDTGAFQAGPACIMLFDQDAPIAMENGPAPLGSEMQMLIGTGQGIPSGRGRFIWNAADGRVVPVWDPAFDAEARANTDEVIRRLNEMNAGEDATARMNLDQSVTFHPLGGCVLGQTTDLYGRVNNQDGLYVVDGALIPGVTPLSNPFWTVSANAERCIERIIAEDYAEATT
ncbi:GMC oxidoreductase [Sandaracinus amylolyticus]|uniref:Cholesterol oxidase n=1 Tax=Sandaracinus amylolyticus TaxID=927083 RepID=A0A0F6YHU6_9BACT|nr:GMC oxidoreductase [Sandaracinus amylolyticus]AKF05513.1 putative cholesterol oxidase [Sandaracinus amylolyticus]